MSEAIRPLILPLIDDTLAAGPAGATIGTPPLRGYQGVLVRHGPDFRFLDAVSYLDTLQASSRPVAAAALAEDPRALAVATMTGESMARANFDPLAPTAQALGNLSAQVDSALHAWPVVALRGMRPVMTVFLDPNWHSMELVRRTFSCAKLDVVCDYTRAAALNFICPNHHTPLK